MRNYLILIILFFSFYNAIGQGVTVPFTNPKATILGKGYFVTDSGIRAFTPMADTVVKLWVPRKYDTGTAVLFQGLPYYHDGSKWILISTGGYVFDTTYIYQALADTAAAIRGDFPTTDSSLFATQYRLDTTRYNLYAAILNSTFDTTYIYQALSDTANNIRSDLADSLALKVYLVDSNIVYVTPTELADTAANIRADFPTTDSTVFATLYRLDTTRTALDGRIVLKLPISDTASMLSPYLRKVDTSTLSTRIDARVKYSDSLTTFVTPTMLDDTANAIRNDFPTIAGFVQYSDSVTTFVTPTMLNDTASAIRSAIPSLTGYMLKSDSSIFSPNYRVDTTRSGLESRLLSASTTSQQNGYFTKTHYYSLASTYYLELRNNNTTATAHRSLGIDIGDVDRTLTLTGNTSLTGTNTGDQTSIVGITGTLAEFNTALTSADFATGGGTVTGASSGTNTGDNAANTTSNTYADGKVADAINDGTTTIAPSQNAVFDALAGKQASGSYLTSETDPIASAVTGVLFGDGVNLSAALNSDLPTMTATVGGAVPTPPNNTTTFLRGDGTFAAPAGGSGDMVLASAQTNSGAKTFLDATLLHRNVANTFSSKFTNTATAARTWTMQDADGTVAFTASPTFTGTVTHPTPFTLGATSVTTTGTQLNYLNAATGTTGTTSTNLVFSTSPTLITPILGVASATSLNTGTTLNGVVFAKSTTDIDLSSTAHGLTVGGESNSTNLAIGEYSTGTGLQSRNNGAIGALHLNPYSGDVRIGSTYAGAQHFMINNSDAGTGSYIEMGLRNGAGSANALLIRTMGTGFTTSGMNFGNGSVVATSTSLSGGLSIGTQASADFRVYTNNALRTTWAAATGDITTTGQVLSSGGGIGYTTGAGGTVTQITSRATSVTLNELCGNITMFSAAQAANAIITFTLTNSFIAATDYLLVQHISATNGGAWVFSTVCGAGSATISITNSSNASITSATPLRFFVLKATTN